MARTERIMRLLDLLRGREEVRVADLAAALGVSARTLHRDLATLREQGMTIASDTGPGGGVRPAGPPRSGPGPGFRRRAQWHVYSHPGSAP